jgi:hypothetical protein
VDRKHSNEEKPGNLEHWRTKIDHAIILHDPEMLSLVEKSAFSAS